MRRFVRAVEERTGRSPLSVFALGERSTHRLFCRNSSLKSLPRVRRQLTIKINLTHRRSIKERK